MYVGNNDAQMRKVHSYFDIFACCQLLSMKLFHDYRTLFFVTKNVVDFKFIDAL